MWLKIYESSLQTKFVRKLVLRNLHYDKHDAEGSYVLWGKERNKNVFESINLTQDESVVGVCMRRRTIL